MIATKIISMIALKLREKEIVKIAGGVNSRFASNVENYEYQHGGCCYGLKNKKGE